MYGVEPCFGRASETEHAPEPFSWSAPRPGGLGQPGAVGMLGDPLGFAVTPSRNLLAAARDDLGLRIDMYEAVVWQRASDTLPGADPDVGAARFNFRADWLLFRNQGEGMGKVTAQFRQNNRWPEGADISSATGSIVDLDGLRSSRDTAFKRLSYAQSFLDDNLLVTVGRLSPNDYVALNVFASDETTQFLAQIFDGNDVWPTLFQDYTTGVAWQSFLNDWIYLNGYAATAAGTVGDGIDFDLSEGFGVSGEIGAVFDAWGRPTRVSFAWCGTDTNQSLIDAGDGGGIWGNAYAVTVQHFTDGDSGVWFQWSCADEDVATGARSEGALGVTIEDCFGRKGDGFGLAGGWTVPLEAELGTQGTFETYYRLQLTGSLQVTADLQLLLPPASDAVSDPTLVAGLRAVIRF